MSGFCSFVTSIGSIGPGKLNQDQLKYLKVFQIVFEHRSVRETGSHMLH